MVYRLIHNNGSLKTPVLFLSKVLQYYYLIAEKESIPYQVIEKKNLIGKVTGTFNLYPDGYFRIVKKLEKVIFVRWVCGR